MRPTRHLGHTDTAVLYVKMDARPALVYEADRLQSRQVGSHDPTKSLINVSLVGKKICLLSNKNAIS